MSTASVSQHSHSRDLPDQPPASKNNTNSSEAKNKCPLGRKIFLIQVSLCSLAKAVSQAALGGISFIGYLITLGYWKQAKNFSLNQMQRASDARSIDLSLLRWITPCKKSTHLTALRQPINPCFIEPQGDLTAQIREQRIRQGRERIEDKLQREFDFAQSQEKKESSKNFIYWPAPAEFSGSIQSEKIRGRDISTCHFIGNRPTMEDESLITSFSLKIGCTTYPVELFGIFDGHGGDKAAQYVKENLKNKLHEMLRKFCSRGLTNESIWNALKLTFVQLNEEFKELKSGTTATVAMILDGKLWTANIGDSRTILDNGIQLSEDAKPNNPRYQISIKNRGGKIKGQRIDGRLATARAIGDHKIVGVSARPKITMYPLAKIPKKSHLILACDGIYDVSTTKQIATAVQTHNHLSAAELAKNIVYSAYQALSQDNLSVLIVKL